MFEMVDKRKIVHIATATRCLSPRLAGDKAFDMDEQMRFAAESDDILQGSRIGPQVLVCLRKN